MPVSDGKYMSGWRRELSGDKGRARFTRSQQAGGGKPPSNVPRPRNVPAGKPRSRSIAAPIAGPIIRREPTFAKSVEPV